MVSCGSGEATLTTLKRKEKKKGDAILGFMRSDGFTNHYVE